MNSMMKRKVWVLLLAAGVSALLASGCNKAGGKGKNGSDSLSTGMDTMSLEGRIEYLTRLLKASPKDHELLYERSTLLYESGNTDAAIKDVNKAIDHHPDNGDYYHLRGFYAYVQNDDQLALDYFRLAAEFGSTNPETFYQMGQIHFFRKEYASAEEHYNTAIRLDSLDPTYYFAKAFMFQQQGKYDLAESLYDQSLSRDSTFIKSLAQLYKIYMDVKGNPGRALEINDRILSIDSLHPVGRFNQGNFYLSQAKSIQSAKPEEFTFFTKLAISEFGNALARDPMFAQAFYNRGYCFFMLEDYNSALADFNKVVDLDPFNDKAFFMIGSINEFFEDKSAALESYRKALEINPEFLDAAQAVEELEVELGTS